MNTTLPAFAAACFFGVVSMFAGVGIHDTTVSYIPPPITVKELQYQGGRVIYWAVAAGRAQGNGYPAVWSASLSRVEPSTGAYLLCRGSGDGFYWDRPRGDPWPLRALISPDCPDALDPGTYRIKVRIEPDDGARVEVAVAAFTVP